MEIDYTKWQAGVALSDKIVLERCPECGASCHPHVKSDRSGNVTTRYVHAVQIERVAPKVGKDGVAKTRLRSNEHNRFERSSPETPPRFRSKTVAIRWCSPGDAARMDRSAQP